MGNKQTVFTHEQLEEYQVGVGSGSVEVAQLGLRYRLPRVSEEQCLASGYLCRFEVTGGAHTAGFSPHRTVLSSRGKRS